MSFLVPERRFDPNLPEMMDLPDADPRLLEEDLRNLRTINRLFGGLTTVRKHIIPLFDRLPKDQEIRILDLATGSGDHPIALVQLAQSLGRRVRIAGIDRNSAMVAAARRLTQAFDQIEIMEQDILNLDVQKWKSDIVLCSLALHHFSHEQGVELLAAMDRLSTVGFIVNDLHRHWLAACSAWVYTHATTRNPLTLNDSYLSVLRGFTEGELSSMAREAGLTSHRIYREPVFRLVLVGVH